MAAATKWIMVVAGLFTASMIYVAIAPQAALQSAFGETLTGPLAEIVVRSWGFLIALVGAMLVYGAFHPPVRKLVLVVAALSKLFYAGLVLTLGRAYLSRAGLSIALDLLLAALFAVCLAGSRRR